MNPNNQNMCKCPHHRMVPFIILLLGVTFLAGNLGWVSASFVMTAWPILVIVGALTKLCGGMCKCCTH